MMNDVKRQRIKRKAREKLAIKIDINESIEYILDIYSSMIIQDEELEEQIESAEGEEKERLLKISSDLKKDIKEYKTKLEL